MIIQTTLGPIDELCLEKREGNEEDDRARIWWVEYWFDQELVHRSVHVDLKQLPALGGEVVDFSAIDYGKR